MRTKWKNEVEEERRIDESEGQKHREDGDPSTMTPNMFRNC